MTMNGTSTTIKTWIAGPAVLLLTVSVLLALSGCTDLTLDPYGQVTPDQFYSTEAEFRAAIAPVYAQLRTYQGAYHEISQISTDETIIPTRGTDWDDGGIWRRLHQHQWTAVEPYVAGAWGDAYTGVARANSVLANLANSTTELEKAAQFKAELRTLRAWFYYILMDIYGNVPIVTKPALERTQPPTTDPREEVFQFIVSEIKASIPDLPTTPPQFGRMSKGAARAILASMYLNAAVFTEGNYQNISTDSYNSCADVQLEGGNACQLAIEQVNAILNSGVYRLADNYFKNFMVESHTSPEIIFPVGYVSQPGRGWNYSMRVLHYNLIPQTPWNGWATLAETYKSFSDADVRKDMFLRGQMYEEPNSGCYGNNCFSDVSSGKEENRGGLPLVFDLTVPLTGASEGDGVRVLKWEIDPNQVGGASGNDMTIFRLAEMYLIKAEALWALNGPNQQTLDLINKVRARAFDPPQPITMDEVAERGGWEQVLLDARLRELIDELRRRQDLIRFGKFTSGSWAHMPDVNDHFRVLMPIPQGQIDANPNLVQNPGYVGG